jgi:peptide/nickel transport system permease protein
MSRRTTVIATLAAGVAIFLLLLSAQVKFDPISIDRHWIGLPMPPCFVDAKTCEGHVLGTDDLGRDVAARLGFGGQVSLGLALTVLVFELALGIILGALSRFGGPISSYVITRVGDAISCFPALPFLIAIVYLGTPPARASLSAFPLAAITAVLFSPQIIRLVALVGNVSDVVHAVSVQAARDLTRIIILLATVDFFGLGIQPPTPSWGNMLTEWQEDITIAWWPSVFPVLCIFGAVLTIEIVRCRYLANDTNRLMRPDLT